MSNDHVKNKSVRRRRRCRGALIWQILRPSHNWTLTATTATISRTPGNTRRRPYARVHGCAPMAAYGTASVLPPLIRITMFHHYKHVGNSGLVTMFEIDERLLHDPDPAVGAEPHTDGDTDAEANPVAEPEDALRLWPFNFRPPRE